MAQAVPYLIVGALGVAGSFLIGTPKGKQSQAEDMPSINSALRGSPITVSFGANRISAQIVWTNKFKAVRQKSSGKGGKGGGSGGMGAMKGGGAAGQSYLYYWDMIFHFGMMDAPAYISKGWIGSDRIEEESVQNIATSRKVSYNYLDAGLSVGSKDPATVEANEYYFAPGYPTDDPALDNWDYFTSQTSLPCAFPYTAWVGFQQLNLGNAPTVPQMSFEFITSHEEAVTTMVCSDYTISNPANGGTNAEVHIMTGEDGLHYRILNETDSFHRFPTIECIETGSTHTYVQSNMYAMLGSAGLLPAGAWNDYDQRIVLPTAGTPYFFLGMATGVNIGTPYDWQIEVMLLRMRIYGINSIQIDGGGKSYRHGLDYYIGTGNFYRYTKSSTQVTWYTGPEIYGPDTPSLVSFNLSGNPITDTVSWENNFTLTDIQSYQDWNPVTDGVDCTPAYIIYRILTSDVFGFQTTNIFGFTITPDRIDNDTYTAAVQKCIDKGIKISVSYTSNDDLLSILNDLTALFNGNIVEHAGKIYFGYVDENTAPMRTIDNHHLLSDNNKPPVNVIKGALQDGYNKVQYKFLDRKLDYKTNMVEVSDEVDMDLTGPRNKTYPAKFVMTGSLAMMLAEQALWSNLYGKDNYEFKVGWKDADLRPGNVITLVDSYDPILSKGVKALITNWNEKKRGQFDVKAVRIFNSHLSAGHGYSATASISGGASTLIEAPTPPIAITAYELPYEFQGSNSYVYLSYAQGAQVMGAQLHVSPDGANFVQVLDEQPYALSGILGQALPARQEGYVETNVEMWLLPTSAFDASTPTFVQDYDMDDISPALRQAGSAVMVVGSEAMAFEGLTLVGQNHYRIQRLYRGWGGTPISDVTSGARWFQHGAGIFPYPITADKIGTSFFYKIVPYNFAGRTYNISSIQAGSYQIKGLYWKPRKQTDPRVFVQSAISWPASTAFCGKNVAVTSGGCNLVVTWPRAANAEGFGYGGFNNGTFGHFLDDTPNPSYRVDVYSSNGTAVSSFTTTTPAWTYSMAQNSADFGGFGKDLILKVTPFNTRGDGPVSAVRSISVFW